jgi:hypothetical protein
MSPAFSLPAKAVATLIGAFRGVIEERIADDPKPAKLPLTGAELSFNRLRAEKASFIDHEFTICVRAEVRDYFNYGYRNAAGTHYSLSVAEVEDDGTVARDRPADAWMSRTTGKALVERILATKRDDASATYHLRCKLDSRRYRELDNPVMIEVLDWQALEPGGKSWGAWQVSGKPN